MSQQLNMTPNRSSSGRIRAEGFALISAIFLLVVLTALAAFIVQISTQQQMGSAADVQGVRAYQAARAGAEWGVYNHLRISACAATSSFALGGNLAGFTVTVQCLPAGVATTNDENGTILIIRRIVATACNQPTGVAPGSCPSPTPGSNYIEREVAMVAGR